MSDKLIAHYGGSGMWSVVSANGKRAYSVTVSTRGKVKIVNRRGDVLDPTGPTSQEIQRAMKNARDNTQRAAAAIRKD